MSEIQWLVTKDPAWLAKWDELQINQESGMFTQTSTWLNSYEAYGFDFELLLGLDEKDEILTGFGSLIVKAGPFKIYNCPWGPWSKTNDLFDLATDAFLRRAKEIGAFACQLNPSIYDDSGSTLHSLQSKGFKKGNLLNKIYSPIHFNLIHLPQGSSVELEPQLLKGFSENARRNIKSGLKNEVEMKPAQTPEEVRLAYSCFEQNAAREGYKIRDWNDLGPSLTASVLNGNALVFLARHEAKTVGAIWVAKGGRMLSYIMGGVERTEKDLKVGHLLQWRCIQKAAELGYSRYNISVGGSDGVVRFKSSFYPQEVSGVGPSYLVLSPVKYQLFKSGYSFLEKNKKLAVKILKLIR